MPKRTMEGEPLLTFGRAQELKTQGTTEVKNNNSSKIVNKLIGGKQCASTEAMGSADSRGVCARSNPQASNEHS